MARKFGRCPECGKYVALTLWGRPRLHRFAGNPCPYGRPAPPPPPEPEPPLDLALLEPAPRSAPRRLRFLGSIGVVEVMELDHAVVYWRLQALHGAMWRGPLDSRMAVVLTVAQKCGISGRRADFRLIGGRVGSRSGVGLRPDRPFRVGPKELPAGSLICRTHEAWLLFPYEHGCGAIVWGHPGTFYQHRTGATLEAINFQHNGLRVVRCPDCLEPLQDALPIAWEERRS